jgi:hypothetical protein
MLDVDHAKPKSCDNPHHNQLIEDEEMESYDAQYNENYL